MRNALTRGAVALSLTALAVVGGCDCSSCDSGDAPNAAAQPALPTLDTASSAASKPANVATIPVSFEVKGMHCNGCAEAIAQETWHRFAWAPIFQALLIWSGVFFLLLFLLGGGRKG